MQSWFTAICVLAMFTCRLAAGDHADEIAALIAPANLALLKGDAAMPRVQSCVYWLEMARRAGAKPEEVAGKAAQVAGYKGGAAAVTAEHLLICLGMAERLGCLDDAGMAELKKGGAPLIRKGPDAGDRLGQDYVISPIFCQELTVVVRNVELLPIRETVGKPLKVGPKQRALAADLHVAGLLTDEGYRSVLAARQPSALSASLDWRYQLTSPN